ncbi:hypothetical protein Dimus_022265 [Dionaea muscipula]
MMRHMSYVISMKDHELPYGDWLTMVFEAFGVPLVVKKGEEPKKYDFFEDTFLTMYEAIVEGGSGSGEKFYDAEDEAQGSPDLHDEIRRRAHEVRLDGRKRTTAESTPRVSATNSES